jgi:putative hemolysin
MSTDDNKKDAVQINVEELIQSKNPRLLKIIPRFLIRKLKRIVHQDEFNAYLKANAKTDAYTFIENGLKMFGAKIIIKGKENLPENKRIILAANHPLGGLDGGVFIKVVHDHYGELRFPVNDLLMSIPNLQEAFLPVNKHGSHSRQAFKAIDEAYQSEFPICYFPAGLCSRKINGKIEDLEWKKSIITMAVKHKRDVVPVHINGKNSNFFYNLSNVRKKLGIKANIEMLYLVDEMYKQYDQEVVISFGKPIPWQTFDASRTPQEWINYVRQKTYEME